MVGTDAVAVVTVDDQAVFRDTAREVIELTPGFEPVGEAACGEDALRVVEELHPELVLLDVRMPGIDGIEVARRLHAAHPDVVVVLVSLDDPPATAHDCGAAAFVRKQDLGSRLLRKLWVTHGSA